ncbi:hypothetical protein SS50377_22571 [Spironucleus salmonicida]|uniref:Secondary thiamine-phosphate synthase enzyme n=1 Tax=Spironucleus salmonicida TaxID=348837 RepID=V6LBV7_9EUKA|nr:hypothetical protein SS50377_22571 [Spironucleus salmonicida]|eukprot:EST41937.1 hypothetical protein SS50377_18241 [Spironucleus salmonicida]
MSYFAEQIQILVPGKKKGSYLITPDVYKGSAQLLDQVKCGQIHIFLTHTSASISINENADPTVRTDLHKVMDRIAPKSLQYDHCYEGSDDMPSHCLSVICGVDLTIPVREGKMVLGTWQGIYLNEHRNFGGDRKLILTVSGLSSSK